MIVAVTSQPNYLNEGVNALLQQASNSQWGEKVVEYAARICYASEDKMGHAPNFTAARVQEGHEDVIEHGWLTYRMQALPIEVQLSLYKASRYVEIAFADDSYYVSANFRVWRQLMQTDLVGSGTTMQQEIVSVAPSVFSDLVSTFDPKSLPALNYIYKSPEDIRNDVHLLGYSMLPQFSDDRHQHATMLIRRISRAASHQLVRSRTGSFSQASQRYIALEKGKWEAVVPPAIERNPEAALVMKNAWNEAELAYRKLRDLGIRKEDARFLLPNACTTQIVMSMNFANWKHYLWLRALDMAAQWEIREFSLDILRYLYSLAPKNFEKEWDFYQAHQGELQSV